MVITLAQHYAQITALSMALVLLYFAFLMLTIQSSRLKRRLKSFIVKQGLEEEYDDHLRLEKRFDKQ